MSIALDTTVLQLPQRVLMITRIVAFGTSLASSHEIKVVSPSMYEDLEASEYVRDNCCAPLRFQQIYPAEEFSSLPNGRGVLIGFAWRPDGKAATGPRTSEFGRTTLDLSTTSVAPYQMHATFDFNIESPATRVIDRDHLVMETENVRSASGPKEFDYVVTFDKPFLYDTTQGNILLDWIALDGISGSHLADSFWPPSDPTIGNGRAASPYDLQEGSDSLAGVTQFTLVPFLDGDFNADSELDAGDLDLLAAEMQIPSHDGRFDLNSDGVVDDSDRRFWIEQLAGTFLGDADLNGTVQFPDFLTLSNHFEQQGGWAQGDFDGNGAVGFSDFLALSANFGKGTATAAVVPESSSALLLAVGLIVSMTHFCRAQRHVS